MSCSVRRKIFTVALLLTIFISGVYIGSKLPNVILTQKSVAYRLTTTPNAAPVRYLSYQPPGNGWNNQRIALENALVIARLLNRTLLVHPLAPHALDELLKYQLPHGRRHGYLAYNMLNQSNLLKLSRFLDLQLLSEVVPVVENVKPHPQFIASHAHLSWHKVCHSMGYGYWIDQPPASAEECKWTDKQAFTPNKSWRQKCANEEGLTPPVVRYVSELMNNTSEMIYFEEGTLFGVQIRFTTHRMALAAQGWVMNHVQYNRAVRNVAGVVKTRLGQYNAVHIRRIGHIDRKMSPKGWLREMLSQGFLPATPVYIATDEPNKEWFAPIMDAGFELYFAANFSDILNFPDIPPSLQQDMLGIHEQVICVEAAKFVPSIASTFAAFIRRRRGITRTLDGLLTDTLHTSWIKHTAS